VVLAVHRPRKGQHSGHGTAIRAAPVKLDLAAAGDGLAHLGDGREAHAELADAVLRHPVGQQPAQPGHRQHAVREHVGVAGAPGKVDVDMDRVVVARGAAVQRQRGAAQRFGSEGRQGVTRLTLAKSTIAHHRRGHEVGDVFAALVGHARLAHHEFQRAALLVVDVGHMRCSKVSRSPAYAMRW
jgi:hypothetical protein